MRLILALLLLAGAAPHAALAQCRCMNPDPYAALSPEEHRAKFDAALQAASAAYTRVMAAARAEDAKRAKEEARSFVIAWDEVSAGFWMHPPKGLEQPGAWVKWFPLANERFAEGSQLILSADDLKGARKALEGGRWALVRIREENNAVGLPDLVLRARGVQEEIRQALAVRNTAKVRESCTRLRELARAAAKMPGTPAATAWCEKAQELAAAPSAATLAAAAAAADRLNSELGDRLN